MFTRSRSVPAPDRPIEPLSESVTIHYYNTDDGIWLRCTCGWEVHLGFEPTVDLAARHAEAHAEEHRA